MGRSTRLLWAPCFPHPPPLDSPRLATRAPPSSPVPSRVWTSTSPSAARPSVPLTPPSHLSFQTLLSTGSSSHRSTRTSPQGTLSPSLQVSPSPLPNSPLWTAPSSFNQGSISRPSFWHTFSTANKTIPYTKK